MKPSLGGSLAVVTALAVAALPAHAGESHAWAAAKKALPGGLQVVGGLDMGQLKGSQIFQQAWAMGMAATAQKANLGGIKTACGFDPSTVLDSIAGGVDAAEHGVVVIALSGVTETEVDTCLKKLTMAAGKPVTIATKGGVTSYAGLAPKTVYLKWLAKDVLAVATTPDDSKLLAKMTGGGLAGDAHFRKALAAVDTGAAMWAATSKSEPIPEIGATMSGGYGWLTVGGGMIGAEVHVAVDDAKAATKAAAAANQAIAQAKSGGGVPPALQAMIGSIAVKAAGTEVVATGSVKESDLMALASMLGGLGGAPAAPVAPTRSP